MGEKIMRFFAGFKNLSEVMHGQNKNKGFTLVELLIVIVILGLLFSLLIPRINYSMNKAREAGLQSALREYQTAAQSMMGENSGLVYKSDGSLDAAGTIAKFNSYLDPQNQINGSTLTNNSAALNRLDPWKQNLVITFVPRSSTGNAEDKIIITSYGKTNNNGKGGATSGTGIGTGTNTPDYFMMIYYKDGTTNVATGGFAQDIGKVSGTFTPGTTTLTNITGWTCTQ